MLTAEGCAQRRERLWESLPEPCDVLILADPSHLKYFANYAPSPFEFRANEAAAVLVLRPGWAALVGDNLLGPYLERAHVDEFVAPSWYDGTHSAPHRRSHLDRATLELMRSATFRRVGIEASSVPTSIAVAVRDEHPDVAGLDLDPIIRPLRRSKGPDELAVLRRSLAASDAGMAAALERLKPGMTEFEAFLLVQSAVLEALGEAAILYGDFLSGPRCERIGGPPTQRAIQPGDLMLLDFSVVLNGYRGDVANTMIVGGKPNGRQRGLHDACMSALAAGEGLLRPGMACRAIDAAVRGALAEAGGAPDHFPGHSGHGVGLGHPEPPYIVPESDDVLMEGDVVTLEPGQYVPGVAGMRFERNYLITAQGFELLSHHRTTLEA